MPDIGQYADYSLICGYFLRGRINYFMQDHKLEVGWVMCFQTQFV